MTSLPPRWLQRLGQLARGRAARRFLQAVNDPAAAQSARLADVLARNAGTAYGRAHGFSRIDGPQAYRDAVPLVRPAELKPWVDRMMAGEPNVLTAEKPVYYVQTTGSTGEPKHVPVTPSYRAEFQAALHASMWHLYRRFPRGYQGRVLYFVGSARDAVAADGCPVGTMSGYNFTALPGLVRAMYAWPAELFSVRDLRTRSYLALHLAMLAAPSLCGTIFPLSVVLLCRELSRRKGELAHHVGRGTLPADLELSPGARTFYQARLTPRPDIAARLRAAGEGPALVRAAFPELALVVCWTGATAGLYLPELLRWLGPSVAVRDAVYSAAEGWMNVPLGDEEPGGPVCVTGHYLELIPEADFVDGRDSAIGVQEAELGARYAVVLTTSGGCYRYALGDIVEVCGRFGQTPCIRFVRKAGAHTSLVGEKLDEAHVNDAVGEALRALAVQASWFCLAPRLGGEVPGYTLHLEPAAGVGDEGRFAEDLAARVDDGLGRVARDYRGHRADGSLGAVAVALVAPGRFERWRSRLAAEGVADAQLKARHLVDDPGALPADLVGPPR